MYCYSHCLSEFYLINKIIYFQKKTQCVLKTGSMHMLKKSDSVEGFMMRNLLPTPVSGPQVFISEVTPCHHFPGYHSEVCSAFTSIYKCPPHLSFLNKWDHLVLHLDFFTF